MNRTNRHHAPRLGIALCFLLAPALGGCGWQQPKPSPPDMADATHMVVIHAAPKDLVAAIVRQFPDAPTSLPIARVHDGTIVTGFKEYEGAIHIVRRWGERTRFQITVLPDFNDPLGTSHVDVIDQTEEKPSDAQPWYPNPDLRRPERSAEVLGIIQRIAATISPASTTNLTPGSAQ